MDKNNEFTVVSLFDGKSGGMLALKELGYTNIKYFAAEIDKYAESVSRFHFPSIFRLGDVTTINYNNDVKVDLVLAGSPCQSFSNAGHKEGFEGKSGLFWEFIRILEEIKKTNPNVLFMLENVMMKKEWKDIISKALGVEPIEINSTLVSAQNRRRLYWTNIKGITQPKDREILLKDILENNVDEKYYLTEHQLEYATQYAIKRGKTIEAAYDRNKARCLTARAPKRACHDATLVPHIKIVNATKKGYIEAYPGDGVSLEFPNSKTRRGRVKRNKCPTLQCTNSRGVITDDLELRVLTPKEFERLQTLSDDYTKYGINKKGEIVEISNNQRYKMIGNGWTNESIKHILSFIGSD